MRVISFCLWGNAPRYCIGAIENAKLAKKYYPDFVCWFYIHTPSVPADIIKTLETMDNVRVIPRQGEKVFPNLAMSWRFEPHDDPEVELFMSRDTDTRILLREVLAVREWIETGKTFHIMRDCPMHYPKILGGMFGSRKIPGVANMTRMFTEYFASHEGEEDQLFLQNCIYPLIQNDCVIHDEIKRYEGEVCRNFPIRYDPEFNFVGQYVYEGGNRNDEHTQRLREYVMGRLRHRVQQKMALKTCYILSDWTGFGCINYPRIKKHWKKFTGLDTKLVLNIPKDQKIPRHLAVYASDIVFSCDVLKGDKPMVVYSGTRVPGKNVFEPYSWNETEFIKFPDMAIGIPKIFQCKPECVTPRIYENLEGMIELPEKHTDYFPEDQVGKICIVHYSKLVSRRENLEKCLQEQGISDVTWVNWFDRENLTPEASSQNYVRKPEVLPRPLTAGEISNGMAHNYIIENVNSPTLVLEDDIVLGNDFLKKLEKCLENVPSDWDVISAGGNYDNPAVDNTPKDYSLDAIDIVPQIGPGVSTSCFLISNKGAKTIMGHSLYKPFSAPIDYTLSLILPSTSAKVYWIQPWIAFEGTKNGVFTSSLYDRGF